MKKLNTTTDVKKYIYAGTLTQPFLDDEYILNKVMQDYNAKLANNVNANKLQSLCSFIAHSVKFARGEKEFIEQNRFQRTSKEIWESKKTVSCMDYAMLFATFARQLGIPTTILHTAEEGYVIKLKSGEKPHHAGHSFCECFYEQKWILVDPTNRKIENSYNAEKLTLSYPVGGHFNFIPYFRGLDLEVRQSTSKHNAFMDELCQKL